MQTKCMHEIFSFAFLLLLLTKSYLNQALLSEWQLALPDWSVSDDDVSVSHNVYVLHSSYAHTPGGPLLRDLI